MILKKIADKLSNSEKMYKALASDLKEAVYKNFDNQGRPRWTPLAKSTIKDRQRKGYWPGKILQRRSGGDGLLGSIMSYFSNAGAVVGTNKIYAAIHQFGGKIPVAAKMWALKAGKMVKKREKNGLIQRYINVPARPFLKVTSEDRATFRETIKKYLGS